MQEALFWKSRSDGHLICELCPRECVLADGQLGACGVRKAVKGKLYAMTYGQPCAMHIDPVEKKPLFHFHPGERIFSIATIGCNLFCDFCQNWEISKDRWDDEHAEPQVPPARVVEFAAKDVDVKFELGSLLPQEPVGYGLDRAQSPYGRHSEGALRFADV